MSRRRAVPLAVFPSHACDTCGKTPRGGCSQVRGPAPRGLLEVAARFWDPLDGWRKLCTSCLKAWITPLRKIRTASHPMRDGKRLFGSVGRSFYGSPACPCPFCVTHFPEDPELAEAWRAWDQEQAIAKSNAYHLGGCACQPRNADGSCRFLRTA